MKRNKYCTKDVTGAPVLVCHVLCLIFGDFIVAHTVELSHNVNIPLYLLKLVKLRLIPHPGHILLIVSVEIPLGCVSATVYRQEVKSSVC